ncbi:MAG TPA: zinc ribbon domain-containing protein [candidate division WOR-3 bacterium]|uniref:Zinc ribbon domain-containing protein n=1 Tax=candidate division WOR-3 bacterium TaxID=2052148 RepID=A0A9C9ENV6_UNCW3|nr:zinc ribbon domain-containing protein [candidate division WOR-3 bacterium]
MEDKWQELRKIEAQRTDVLTKLKRIEDKKDTVSPEVYEKVKKEYEEKLESIDAEMSKNVELIKEQLKQIEEENEQLRRLQKKLRLELEEIELRYSIGEYSEDDYNKLSAEHKDKLEVVDKDLEKLRERQEWFKKFIDIKDIEETIKEPPVEEEVTTEASTEDIQIEEHILEEKLPEEETKLDELIVEEKAVLPEATVEEESPKETESPIEEIPTEKEKSVSCPKCGHMNTPDSWYCEKCGAEILDSPVSD